MKPLEGRVRVEQRVPIVEPGDETDREPPLRQGIDETAAELLVPQRVAHRVHHPAGRDLFGWDLPELLDRDRIGLRHRAVEPELPDERLRQVAANAVGEDRDGRPDVDTGLEGALPLPLFIDAPVTGAHTDHAVTLVEHLGTGEAGEHIDALGLGLLRQPAHEPVQ